MGIPVAAPLSLPRARVPEGEAGAPSAAKCVSTSGNCIAAALVPRAMDCHFILATSRTWWRKSSARICSTSSSSA
eukprot:12912128-Prorocentrum_lima.AAC.1